MKHEFTTDETRAATAWAAQVITNKGGKLFALTSGWDVQMPDGSWRAVENWRELCIVAHEIRRRF